MVPDASGKCMYESPVGSGTLPRGGKCSISLKKLGPSLRGCTEGQGGKRGERPKGGGGGGGGET
jgi:hypothetical protein